MDLAKVSDAEKLTLCKRYFYIGCAFLPFLWAVNFVWFFQQAFLRKPAFDEQPHLRKFVIGSGVGAFVWLCVFIGWQAFYQTHRVQWGALGDSLSFVIPLGQP